MVVTAEKLQANRANAELSTGPRTAEGKLASSRNATAHGAYAEPTCGDPAYELFRREQVVGLNPRTAPERFLADRAASLMWRLRRLQDATLALDPDDDRFDRLIRAEQRLTGMLNTTFRNLKQLRSRRQDEAAPQADEELQNEPTATPSPSSERSVAPALPPKLRNEPKPKTAHALFQAAARAANDLLNDPNRAP